MNHKLFLVNILFIMISCQYQQKSEMQRGNNAYKKGNFASAMKSYQNVLNEDSTNAEAIFNKANATYQENMYSEAIEGYNTIINEPANNSKVKSEAFYNKGNALLQQGNADSALIAYKQAMRLNPNDFDAKYNYTWIKKRKNQNQKNGNKSGNLKDLSKEEKEQLLKKAKEGDQQARGKRSNKRNQSIIDKSNNY